MSNNEMNPDVKKAIWKIVVYAVTIFASLFAGNYAADANIIHSNPKYYENVKK